jgi:predicted GNAT family N-acyltransferase
VVGWTCIQDGRHLDPREIEFFRRRCCAGPQGGRPARSGARSCGPSDLDDRSAFHFTARDPRDRLIGCARLHIGAAVPASALSALHLDAFVATYDRPIGYVSCFVVDPAVAHHEVAGDLLEDMIDFLRDARFGVEVAFGAFSASATAAWARLGWRPLGAAFDDPRFGCRQAMALFCGDAGASAFRDPGAGEIADRLASAGRQTALPRRPRAA